jgi:hypothetical protein
MVLTRSACAALLACAVAVPVSLRAADVRTRTIYVSAVTKDGTMVKDLTAADLEVKEGGKVQNITVKPATSRIRMAILVSDGGTGAFQAGIADLINKLLEVGEFEIVSVLVQPEKITDFTSDVPKLKDAIGSIGKRAQAGTMGQLMEAIDDATRTVPAEGKRGVIVATRVGLESPSTTRPENVRKALIDKGTSLYVVSTIGAERSAGSQQLTSSGGGKEAAQVREQDLADSAFGLQLVLGDGSDESGGRHEEVPATTMRKVLAGIGDELLAQYEITYTLPDGQKPSEKVQVTTKRKDTKINAPTKLPTK